MTPMTVPTQIRTTWLLVFLGAMLTSVDSANADVRILDIKGRVAVTSAAVTLVDLVAKPDSLSDYEKELVIADAPETAEMRRMSLVSIAYLLQKHPELLDVQLRGPNWVTILKTFDMATVAQAKKEILKTLRETAPWKDWRTDVLFSSDDERKLGRAGAFSQLRVVPMDSHGVLGRVPLRVTFLDADELMTSEEAISPVIVRQVQAVVACDALEAGHTLSRHDLQFSPIWAGRDNLNYVSAMDRCIGQELKRRLPPGAVITERDLISPVSARRGDIIWVTCETGELSVRVAVRALETGREGESVRVKNPSSQRVFRVELNGTKSGVLRAGT